jgi:hypothetical protein
LPPIVWQQQQQQTSTNELNHTQLMPTVQELLLQPLL